MKTISAQLAVNVSNTFTSPGYLVALTLADGSVRRYSSRGPLSWQSQNWEGFIVVTSIDQQAGGVMSAKFFVEGDILNALEGTAMKPVAVKIWQGDEDQMMLAFGGNSSRISVKNNHVDVEATNWTHNRPLTISAPLLEYITPVGTVVDWGGRRIILEASR